MKKKGIMEIPYGYCQCGCGQKTKIAKFNTVNLKAGEPRLYLHGHSLSVYQRERKILRDL